MKRPAILTAAAVVPFSFLLSLICDIRFSIAAAALSLAAVFVMLFFRKKKLFSFLIITAAALLVSSLFSVWRLYDAAVTSRLYDSEGTEFTGIVLTEPDISSDGDAVFDVAASGRPLSRLRFHADVADLPASLTTGDTVYCTVAGITKSAAAARSSLAAGVSGEVFAVGEVTVTASGKLPIIGFFNRLSASASETVYAKVGDRFGNIAAAAVTGKGLYLAAEEDVAALRGAGIAHYFCVSGFHLSVFTGVLLFFTAFFDKKGKISFVVAVAASLFAVLFAGFTPSVLRAAFMCVLASGAYALGRQTSLLNTVTLAASLFLLFDSFALFSASFALSFASVFGIALVLPLPARLAWKITKDEEKVEIVKAVVSPFFVALGASALTLPVSALFFGSGPVYSVFANLVCGPFATVLFASAAFALFPDPAVSEFAAVLCRGAASVMTDVAKAISALPYSTLSPSVTLIIFFVIFAFFAYFALKKKSPRKARVIFAAAAILFLPLFMLSGKTAKERLVLTRENGISAAEAVSLDEGFTFIFYGDGSEAEIVLKGLGAPDAVYSDGGPSPSPFDFEEFDKGLTLGVGLIRAEGDGAVAYIGENRSVLFLRKGSYLKNICRDGVFYDIIICEGCPEQSYLLSSLGAKTVVSVSSGDSSADALSRAAEEAGAVFRPLENGKTIVINLD